MQKAEEGTPTRVGKQQSNRTRPSEGRCKQTAQEVGKGSGRAQADAWRQEKAEKCRLFCSSLCFSSTAAYSWVCPGILTCYCLKELGIIL